MYLYVVCISIPCSSLQFNEGSAVYAEASLVTLAESTQFVGGYSAVQTTTPGTAVALHGGSLLHVDQVQPGPSTVVVFQTSCTAENSSTHHYVHGLLNLRATIHLY